MSQIQLNIPPPPPSNPSSHGAVEYDLHMRQEPKQARMCGVGGKADRRPIDPPPIIQLVVRPTSNKANTSPEGSLGFLQNPYYFMFASLAKPDDDTELHWLKDGRTRCTQGSVVSSLYHLKDRNNEDVGFFVFPDVSVRTEGSYRLKLSLFEVAGNMVRHCKSIFSKPFYVYTAKKFPGMEQSTELSCSLADQGIKIRIRKDIRVRGPKEPDRKRQRQDNNDHDQSVVLTSTSTLQDTPSASSASIPPPPGAQLAIPPPPGAQGIPPPPGVVQSIPPPPGAQTIQPPPGAQVIPTGASHGSNFPSPSSPAPVSVAGAQGPPPTPHVSMPPPSHVPIHPSGHPLPQDYYPHPYDHHYYSTMWHYPSYPPPTPHEGYPPPSHPAGPGHQRPPAPGYPPPPPPYYYPHPSHPHSAWGTPPGWVPPPGEYPPRGDYGQQPQREYAPPPREYAPPGRPGDYVPPRTNEYTPPGRPIEYPPRPAPTEYSRSLEYGSPHARPGEYQQREYQRDYTPATSQPPTPHSHHIPPPPGAQRLGVDDSYVPRDSYAQASQRDYTPISREYSSQQTAHSSRSEYSPREYSPEPASRREYIPAISSHRTSAEYGRSSVSGYPPTNGPYSASSTGSYGPSSAYGPPSSSSSGSFPPSSAASSGSFPSAYPISPAISPTIQGNKLSIGSILRKERD